MKTIHNILTKIFLILLLIAGWGSTAWAQTSQLPLASGVYELKNISNEGGDVGRGYLVSYTGYSGGLGLAECPWADYTSAHPDNRNNGTSTCSYFYLHANDNGTYTLVSLSTLNGNDEPKFVKVGANQGKSTLVTTEQELVLTDGSRSKDGKKCVLIANSNATNVYLSAACGTNSNNGAAGATSNSSDGGVPWLFISVSSSAITAAQQTIIDKYLGNVYTLSASEYSLSPATATTVGSISSVTISINAVGKTVKCVNEGGSFGADDQPYIVLSSALSNKRAHKAAPAGAKMADVTKVSDGVYNLTFDEVTDPGAYTLVIPLGAFIVNDGSKDLPVTELRSTYAILDVMGETTLRFTDAAGNTLPEASVVYTPANGDPSVTLSPANTSYNFPDEFAESLFSADGSNTNFTYGKVSYDKENSTLTFILSPHVIPTGVYRMVASKDDRGFFVDAENYVRVAKNRHKTSWDAPTVANSLWYVYNTGGNQYYISSLSSYASRGADHVAFLKGTGNGNSFELDNPTTWLVDYQSTSSRFSSNHSGYDTTIPTPDYFTVKLSDTKLLTSTPGYDNDGSCRLSSYESGASDIEFQPYAESLITDPAQQALLALTKSMFEVVTLDGPVNLRFVDAAGTSLPGASVLYTPAEGVPVVLSTENSQYDFAGAVYNRSFFGQDTSNADFTFAKVSYDKESKTLTFILSPHTIPTGIYRLSFSTQDRGNLTDIGNTYNTLGRNAWQRTDAAADNTNSLWYVHRLKSGEYTIASLSPYAGRGEDLYFLKGTQANTFSPNEPTPWTFTYKETRARGFGNGQSQFFGNYDTTIPTPDYFEIRPNSWETTQFVSASPGYDVSNRVRPGGHEVEATYIEFNAISESELAAGAQRALYDRLKADILDGDVNVAFVDGEGNPITTADVVYHPSDGSVSQVIYSSATSYHFEDEHLIGYLAFDLFSTTSGYDLTSVSYDAAANLLTFTIVADPSATEEYTVIITNGTADSDYDVSTIETRYLEAPCRSNHFIVRPGTKPKETDFVISGADDKFIWGPVVDTKDKTVTFDIRDHATTFTTGLYQLCLKGQDDIDAVNGYISMFDSNINTASQYLYLAPSVYKAQGMQMKFTGVPSYADEPSTYIYIVDNGNSTVNISASGQAVINNIPYTFDAATGEITFTNYSYKDYSSLGNEPNYEPKEQPAFLNRSDATSTFVVHPVSMEAYDAYTLVFAGDYSSSTKVKYTKDTPTGVTLYANNDMFVVNKGYTAFQTVDFAPTDARCTAVEIVRAPEGDVLGELRLTLDLPVANWNVAITGSAATDADRVVYKGVDYPTGSTVPISGVTLDLTTIKTNVTDRFVWGPIVNEDTRTITFDIRPLATVIVDGWYQIQLLGDQRIADANYRITHNAGNINTAASYIYVLPMYNTTNSVLGKYGGVPTYAGEASSYFRITRDGANIRIQSPDGRYAKSDGALEYGQTDPTNIATWQYSDNQFKVNKWTAPSQWGAPGNNTGMGSNAGNQGPIVATGGSYHQEHFITKVDPTTLYDVYQVDLTGTGETKVRYTGASNNGNSFVYNNGYFFLTKGDAAPTKEQFLFEGSTKTIESISIDGGNVITFTLKSPADGYTNTIIHRQHAVYDLLEITDPSLRPGSNHIQAGEGLIEQPNLVNPDFDPEQSVSDSNLPYRKVVNPNYDSGQPEADGNRPYIEYTGNDLKIQNTSTYIVTQYVPRGQQTECVLPFARSKAANGFARHYQRVYDYLTERPLDDAIIGTDLDTYVKVTNGHYSVTNCTTVGGKSVTGFTEPSSKHVFTLPAGKDEVYIAFDNSAFNDFDVTYDSNGNILEPSLSSRVIFHLIAAEKMELKPEGTDQFFESGHYYVANVKRGLNEHGNNLDLLPLSMPYSNYWFPSSADGNPLMPVAPESDENLNNVVRNIDVEIEGTASDGQPISNYVEVGVFTNYPGAKDDAQPKYPSVDHFVYYKYLGDGFKRTVPANSVATVKVYAKDGPDATVRYELAKYTLEFVPDAEPLAITNVVGNSKSTRSEDYFLDQKYEQVASLTFENKDVAYTGVNVNKGDDHALTYAFPIDFSRTSYAYNSTWEFGTYGIMRSAYNTKFMPVALYEKNIKDPTSLQTNMADDYHFYIDAAEQPGQVASVPFDGSLCAGSRLFFYGWLSSANFSNTAGASLVLRLVGVDSHGDRHVVANYLTGQVSDVAYDEDGTAMRSLAYGRTPSWNLALPKGVDGTLFGAWQQVGFSLSIENNGYESYELQIINNAYSTAGGDYVLDDFKVYVAPATPRVEFLAGLCSGAVPHLKVIIPREAVHDINVNDGMTNVSYCFLDKDKYDSKLEELGGDSPEVAHYNAAFNYALMGNGTNADVVDTDGSVVSYRSFWNESAAFDDARYEAYKEYDFVKIFSETDGYSPNGVYRAMSGATSEIVYCHELGKVAGWEENHDYYVVFTQDHVTDNFTSAGCGKFNMDQPTCQSINSFRTRPSITLNSDVEEVTQTPPLVCRNQVASVNNDLHGYGPNNVEVVLKHQMYDWWLGYGKTAPDADVVKADVHDYLQQQHDGIYLSDAIEHFRAHYPTARTIEGCEPKAGDVEGYGDVTFTQEDKDCILHFLQPNAYGRVALEIGTESATVHMLDRDAVDENGQRVIYCTVIPIRPHVRLDAASGAIFCPEPQEMKFVLQNVAPSMQNGFTKLHDQYPTSMYSVPIRMGLKQIDAVRLNAQGNIGSHHLRIPVRGIDMSYKDQSSNVKIGKNKKKKKGQTASEATTNDYVYLTKTDDPAYADKAIVNVDEDGITEYLKVGRVDLFNAPYSDLTGGAKGATEAHVEVGFMRDFQPREGFVYKLKIAFEEDVTSHPNYNDPDFFVPCESGFEFELKVIPEYIQWTGAADNAEWSNDGNWARADRSVLLADNDDSQGGEATRYGSYQDNAGNYAEDDRYKAGEVATGHVFTPMYFTNVLLSDPNLPAPVLVNPTLLPDINDHFLEWSGESNATQFIKYDMLATPIKDTGYMDPLVSDDRFGIYNKNFGFEPFWPNVCDGLTFLPGTSMYDAQYLHYNKAWVEYELDYNRWYTLASPLQGTYAGEWYSPTAGGRQLTPHFCDITYNETLNDRFNPAYYQRSWDKAGEAWIYRSQNDDGKYVGFEHDTQNADYVRVQKPTYLNWSYVYNDVEVPYSNGGFSVNVRYTDAEKAPAAGSKALVRLPKADATYSYYENGDPTNGGDASPTLNRTGHYRLMSDALTASTINQSIQNASPTNPYFLVGNPFMAPMNMDQFFAEQTCQRRKDATGAYSPDGEPSDESTFVSGKYWILEGTKQNVNIKVDGDWISTNDPDDNTAGVVAPLQGFFVQMPVDAATGYAVLPESLPGATTGSGARLSFSADVQQRMEVIGVNQDGSPIYGYSNGEDGNANPIYGQKPSLKSRRRGAELAQPTMFRITATNGSQLESTAVVYFTDKASAHYDTREDAETLLDGNIADKVSTVFTSAPSTGSGQAQQALQINTMPAGVTVIPVGVIAPKDDTRTTLRFTGIGALEAAMPETPHLYDAAEGTLQVLDEGTTVSVTGTTAGRYFIVSGTTLPVVDDNDDDNDNLDGRIYDLRGIRVNSVQHGTVTISRSRKEYNK